MMHEKARQRFEGMLRDALPWPGQVDILLDEYADNLLRATEWDADQWGLPTPEMRTHLGAILSKAGGSGACLWPREAI
jgi:hypothetical protein